MVGPIEEHRGPSCPHRGKGLGKGKMFSSWVNEVRPVRSSLAQGPSVAAGRECGLTAYNGQRTRARQAPWPEVHVMTFH